MKVSIFLRRRPNAKGLCPVYFKASNGRGDQPRTPTEIKVNAKYWKEGQVSTKHPNAAVINLELKKLRNRGEEAELKWDTGEFNNTREVIAFLQGKQDNHSLESYLHTTLKQSLTEGNYNNTRWAIGGLKRLMNHKGEIMFSDVTPQYISRFHTLAKQAVRRKENKPETYASYGSYLMYVVRQAKRQGIITKMPDIDTKYYFNLGTTDREVPSHTWQEIIHCIGKADTIQKWQSVAFWLLMFGLRGLNNADISRISDSLLVEIIKVRGKEKLVSVENKDFMREMFLDYGRSKNANTLVIQLFPPVLTLLKYLKNSAVYTYIDKKLPNGKRIIRGMEDRTNVFDYDLQFNKAFHSQLWAQRQDKWKLMSDDNITFNNARNTFYQVGEGLGLAHMDLEKLIGHSYGISSKHYSNLRRPQTIRKMSRQHRDILEEFRYPQLVTALVKQLYKLCAQDKAPKWVLASTMIGNNKMLTIDIDEQGNIKENMPMPVRIEDKYLKYFTNIKDIEVDSFSQEKLDIKRQQRIYDRLKTEAEMDLKVVHKVDVTPVPQKVLKKA